VAAVAEGDPSAAWCASIAATLARMCSYLPPEGQRELWAEGPDAFIVGALMPGGRAERADGGWLVNGEWPFMSGIHHSDWALVCAAAPEAEGRSVRFFVIPRAAYGVAQSWFNVGMRATGSDTIVVEDVFVPAHRTFTRDELLAGRAPEPDARCRAVPLKAVNGLSFAAPVLGAARGALRDWTAWTARKAATPSAAPRVSGSSSATANLVLARVAGQIDAAALLLERAATVADRGEVSELETARSLRDCSLAVEMLVDAVNALFRAAGTRAQSETGGFQRFWRDANTAAGHVVLQFEPAAAGYAGLALAEVAHEKLTAETGKGGGYE
jgi:alkylation response protein AidB-like acyl-CoA dehydrogenase